MNDLMVYLQLKPGWIKNVCVTAGKLMDEKMKGGNVEQIKLLSQVTCLTSIVPAFLIKALDAF